MTRPTRGRSTLEALRAAGHVVTRRKYRNTPTVVDGIRFDSKREAKRWGELRALERDGLISQLKRQVRFRIEVNGVLICVYVADFVYFDGPREPPWEPPNVVEDAKGVRTREYKLKAKLMRAVHRVTIREV